MTAYGILWLVAMIVFIIIECFSYQLMSIWMAVGALVALICHVSGADFFTQFIVFLIVSIVLVILTRPFVKRFLDSKNIKTNVDDVIGKSAIVTSEIYNLENKGTVKIGGMEWSARAEDNTKIEAGKVVKVLKVEGVKVIVKED